MYLSRWFKFLNYQQIHIRYYSKKKILRIPWKDKEEEFSSGLKLFESPLKKKRLPQNKILPESPASFNMKSIREWMERLKFNSNVDDQNFNPERHLYLGNELAAAHFLVARGASIKFVGEDEWIIKNSEGKYNLPNKPDDSKFVESIDCTNFSIAYEGLFNMKQLTKLKWLSFNNNKFLDDWGIDWVCGEFTKNLQHLDISNCNLLTENCLSSIAKLENIQTLVVHNIAKSMEWELACLLLNEVKPSLKIEGVNYIKLKLKDNIEN